ncbi:hypothetical protein LAV73_08610 [Lysinibacillus xylanilyticus]|uniref:contact-dependent growth inhibition system immunity protein n=1 Tax=Lysinibacillus xylanilyticus TaxID=582475 RepID=UPI002B39CE60|nr:hypothetical protein [Lysinibacillus xylanilyticus]
MPYRFSNFLLELAIKKAIEYLHKDPLVGSKFDGQLMETLLSTFVLHKLLTNTKNHPLRSGLLFIIIFIYF